MAIPKYDCVGQLELTDLLRAKVADGRTKNLTTWINSHGKSQYEQIGEVVEKIYYEEKDSKQIIGRITNAVSIYVLEQSAGYMEYLRKESEY